MTVSVLDVNYKVGDIVQEIAGLDENLVVDINYEGEYVTILCLSVAEHDYWNNSGDAFTLPYVNAPGETDRTDAERYSYLRTPSDEERVMIKLQFGE